MKNTTESKMAKKLASTLKKLTAKQTESTKSYGFEPYHGPVKGITVRQAILAALYTPFKGGAYEGFGSCQVMDLFDEVRVFRPRTTWEQYQSAVETLERRNIIANSEGRLCTAI